MLDPICGLKYEILNNNDKIRIENECGSLSYELEKVILNSNIIDLTDLCIETEKSVWVLYIDILCLCDNGNLFDACILGIISSLNNLKIPITSINKDGIVYIKNEDKNKFKKLKLKNKLLPLTLGILNDKIIVDPTNNEMELLSCIIKVVYNDNLNEIVYLNKIGGENMKLDQFQSILLLAKNRAKELKSILNNSNNIMDNGNDINDVDMKSQFD